MIEMLNFLFGVGVGALTTAFIAIRVGWQVLRRLRKELEMLEQRINEVDAAKRAEG